MQQQLAAVSTARPISILGVNSIDAAGTIDAMIAGRTLPLLQDTAAADVWQRWQVTYRDVVILDDQGRRRWIFNLTEHDLADRANFDALKQLLLDEAAR